MPIEVVMPRLNDSMEEGTVLKWLKRVGEEVKKGDPLVEIATDKANMEMEAYDSGVLDRIVVAENQTVPIGETIAILRQPGEAAAAPPPTPSAAEEAPPAAEAPQAPAAPAPAAEAPSPPEAGERIKVSPLARRVAEEQGVDLAAVTGTGPGGRITKEDVEEFAAKRAAPPAPPAPAPMPEAAAAPPAEPVELTRVQEIIVRRMVESKTTVPHFYVTSEIDMVEAGQLRKRINASAGEGVPEVSYNDLVVKAAALTLRRFPEANSFYRDGKIQPNPEINIGIAVAMPDSLVVPVIRRADQKTLRQIAAEARALIERSRAGKPHAEDYAGGTFTVSNLGMYDVEEFIAIINPPQSSILAVGSIKPKAVVVDGQLAVSERMRVTLSSDHRVYYGATAALFLRELKRLLENPLEMLA